MDRGRGYTLLELMLVVALVAIFGAVAFPVFTTQAQRAKEHAAIADIGDLTLRLYRFELNSGSFPETLGAAGLDGRLDPWGSPYVYLKIETANSGKVRKDKNLVPINTDFDLYSKGPDGESAAPLTAARSRDDIVRANDGGFIGRAADY